MSQRNSVGQRKRTYSVLASPTDKSNEFNAVVHHNGKPLRSLTMVSSTFRSAYFSDQSEAIGSGEVSDKPARLAVRG